MNDEHNYDEIIVGTSIVQLKSIYPTDKKILVIDKKKNYGSTFSLKTVETSPYINNLKILKSSNQKVFVETIPTLFYAEIDELKSTKYLKIKNHYIFYDTLKFVKICYSWSQIVDSDFCSKLDKTILRQLKINFNVEIVKKLSQSFKSTILEAFKVYDSDTLEYCVRKYVNLIDSQCLVYPVYGCSEVSESLSRFLCVYFEINFFLSPDINVELIKNEYLIKSEHGTMKSNVLKEEKNENLYFFRVILYNKIFYEETLFAVFKEFNLKCFVLNGETELCENGKYLIYFWNQFCIEDKNLVKIGLNFENVEMDLCFESRLDRFD